jgi:hypothetical protein
MTHLFPSGDEIIDWLIVAFVIIGAVASVLGLVVWAW